MPTTTTPSQPPRKWRVTAIEWLSHVAIIDADTAEQAEARARQLWVDNSEHEEFRFSDSGIDGFVVEEIDGAETKDDGRAQP